jgi:sulfhydrogenase subunit delta
MKKLNVGVFNITGCCGCVLKVIFNEKEVLDMINLIHVSAFPFIKEIEETESFDMILLEGTVVHAEDLDTVKKLRNKTKILVALGACACTGGITAFRNFISPEHYQYLKFKTKSHLADFDPQPIDNFVKVDYYVPGCPPDNNEILLFIKDIVLNKKPELYDKPVCMECRMNENECLLDKGKLCLGPITRGNCSSVCTNGRLECWGCRGPTSDANYDEMLKLLQEKGFNIPAIKERIKSFVGLKMPKEVISHEQSH